MCIEKHFLTLFFPLPPLIYIIQIFYFTLHNSLPQGGDVLDGTPDGRAILLGGLSPLALPGVLMAPWLSMSRMGGVRPVCGRGTRPSPVNPTVPLWGKEAEEPKRMSGWQNVMLDHLLHHLAHDTTCCFTSKTFIALNRCDDNLLTLTHIVALKAPTERDAADNYYPLSPQYNISLSWWSAIYLFGSSCGWCAAAWSCTKCIYTAVDSLWMQLASTQT